MADVVTGTMYYYRKLLGSTCLISLATSMSSAAIVFNRPNADPLVTTDPATGMPWESVARVANSDGSSPSGSAVYLGDRYMLTADHVKIGSRSVSFDGSTWIALDTSYTPQQVAANTDLKIFRLASDPGVAAVKLNAGSAPDLGIGSFHVGWGVGRADGVLVNDTVQTWGDASTIDKRWGTNDTSSQLYNVNYGSGSYVALGARTDPIDGESALALYDSGSGLFAEVSDNWYLVGIATTVSTRYQTTFSNSPVSADTNYFARISEYAADIDAIVPEPSTSAGLTGLGALALALAARRRRRRHELR